MSKKKIALLIVLIAGGAWCGWKYYNARPQAPDAVYFRSQKVARGSVTQEVTATGTVQPVRKVSVTTQVTGKIITLRADFNSAITQGEVIAEIDPDNYKSSLDNAKAQLASARAQLKNNQASLEKTTAQLTLAEKELKRQKKLFEHEMTTESELDNAQATYDELRASKKSNEAAIEQSNASIAQAEASVRTAEKNLADCTITSPVNGIVIDRSVEEGQTVVSSMNATGLFTVATDLSRVKVEAAIPEADIGVVKVGQDVSFTVDAYKTTFFGTVTQIRLASATNSNVVTYPVIIEADNPDERLFPGMTANLSIIIEKAADAVVVPNAATRFTPPRMAAAPHNGHPQGQPPDFQPGQDNGAQRPKPLPDGDFAVGDKDGDRMPGTPPGFQPNGDDGGLPPMPAENAKMLWIADSSTQIHPVMVELGISDGVNTVVTRGGEALLGKRIVIGKQSPAAAKAAMDEADGQTSNPFMPPPPGRKGKDGKTNGPPPGPPM